MPWVTPKDSAVFVELRGAEVPGDDDLEGERTPRVPREGPNRCGQGDHHGFEVRRPSETTKAFLSRINRLARDEENGTHTIVRDANWTLGDQLRRRGSLHSDVWSGTAADLADRGVLAVYPAIGWWRRRTSLERYERTARYSLIVSIEAPETPVDAVTITPRAVMLPRAVPDDLVAVFLAGAYGLSASPQAFLAQQPALEMVGGGRS